MRLITLVFFMFALHFLGAQKNMKLIFEDNSYQQLKKHPTQEFKDSLSLFNYLNEFQFFAIKKGFLLASFDEILRENATTYRVKFTLGEKFHDAVLHLAPEELYFLKKTNGLSEKVIAKTPLTPTELSRILTRIHETYLNEGFPFAKVQLDSTKFTHQNLEAEVSIYRGPQLKWQKIHIRGDSSLSVKYVSNLIGIKSGEIYREKDLATISKRIRQVNFLKELKPAEVLFTKEGSELFVYLESVPNSSINGIVGLQPNPTTQRLQVTGEVTLKLINVIKKGELLTIDWRAIQPQTQSLKSQLSIPFLFKTPFGVDGKFNLFKRDSTFLELVSNAGVNYFLKGGSYIKAFYQNNSSSLLSGGQSSSTASNFSSVKTNSYGLAFYRRQLDYLPNPSKGFFLNIESSIGSRQAQQTDSSLIEKSTVFRGLVEIEFYIPLAKRHVLRLKNESNFYYAPIIYANEVHRFGGLTAQRGFNEQELFSTAQSTLSLEYRFLVDQNSYAFAFFDQSWYENNATKYLNDLPYGFGLGFSFGTNLGIFSISYALGKQFDNPIQIRNGKIHFGYVAYF